MASGIHSQRSYTAREELAHRLTHGFGTWLSAMGLALLVVLANRSGHLRDTAIFGFYGSALVFMYLASTLYHSFSNQRVKHYLKIMDHCSIYLLIAGTYTPFTLVVLRGAWGWTLFGIIWALTLLGVIFKVFLVNRFKVLSVCIYIMMGWLVVLSLKEMAAKLPAGGIAWLVAGGLFYTLGVFFYVRKQMPYHHAIWHLFVLGGSICHYLSVLLYVLPLAGI